METSLWAILFLAGLIVFTGFARLLRVLLLPDSTGRELAACKDRLHDLEYRLRDMQRELQRLRSLVEGRPETRSSPSAATEQRITKDEDSRIYRENN